MGVYRDAGSMSYFMSEDDMLDERSGRVYIRAR